MFYISIHKLLLLAYLWTFFEILKILVQVILENNYIEVHIEILFHI